MPNNDENRILFLSDHLGYGDGVVHGASTYFMHVLPALKRAGVGLTVCFLRERHLVAERLEAEGVRPVFLERGKWDVRALGDVVRLIRENRIEVIHAAGMKGILIGKAAAKWTGAKCVIHLHDTNPLDPVTRMLQRMTAGWADRCIAISKAVGGYAQETMGMKAERVRVIYNPLPDSATGERPPGEDPGDVAKLAIVGRLAPEKGHGPFLRAAADWLKARPEVRLMVIGEGPLRAELEALVQSLGLSGQVEFTGQRDDVAALLREARVLVVPSLREGLGYVALEAMAAGCPVAAYAVGGLAEMIEDGKNGLLAPEGNASAMLANLDRILTDQTMARRLAQAGRERVKDFNMDAHVSALLSVYDEARRAV